MSVERVNDGSFEREDRNIFESIFTLRRTVKENEVTEDVSKKKKLLKLKLSGDEDRLIGLILAINAFINLTLGATILKLSAVAGLYINRIRFVAPGYEQYIGIGSVIGWTLVLFAIVQVFLSAYKLYSAKEVRKAIITFERGDTDV
jgi:CBS domain containing-hemolysin-like protein